MCLQCFQAKLLSVLEMGGVGGCMVSSYGTLLQCCTRSQAKFDSLLSGGPFLYKCSIRSLAWFYVLVLYLVTFR